jgi:N12 class adenine-specific DNA methylase
MEVLEMSTKLQAYSQMADHTATQITVSYLNWMAFLQTAARLYKHPYNEQLMIYAQKPEATACAEYGFWNERMGRYVRRGSKGIALIDASSDRPHIKYVFDVSDTGGGELSRRPFLWELREEHIVGVTAMLERNYDVPGGNLADQLEYLAAQLTDEYWSEHQADILPIVDGSFLEEYDDINIGVAFRNAAAVSITYSLMSRCGMQPDEYFSHEDFLSIFDFNTPATVAALGTAVSEINQRVLRQIEITVKYYEREHIAERSVAHGEQLDLSEEWGLSNPQPDSKRTGGEASGQVRADAEELSEGTPPDSLEQHAPVGKVVSAPSGDRPDGPVPLGADDTGAGEGGRGDGDAESQRPDEVGGADEQLQGASGGDYYVGADLQLSLFPSEEQQIQCIETAESIKPSAVSMPQEEIDAELRHGTGYEGGKLRIYALYQHGPDSKATMNFLKDEYGWFGHSHTFLDGTSGFVDYRPGQGMILHHYSRGLETIVKWAAIDKRLRAMITADNYLTAKEKAQYAEIERDHAGLTDGVPMPNAIMQIPPPVVRASVQEALEPTLPAQELPVDPQAALDIALQEWNGDIQSKHTVMRYMKDHARDKDTAAFLRAEYGDDLPAFPVTTAGMSMDISWPKVQCRIAQLIQENKFYTQEEQENLDDVDPIAIRERLEQAGIAGEQVVDLAALERDPFNRQVEADVVCAVQDQPDSPAETPTPLHDIAMPPYKVGDTVYLDNTAFIIENIGDYNIQLRDPTLLYPIFRCESKEPFERMLKRDYRNGAITELLPGALAFADKDLRDALTGEGGLLALRNKEIISGWLRAGEGNTHIAQRLSEIYAGTAETMTLLSGEAADYFATTTGFEVEIQDKYNTKLSFSWNEIAPILRAMYQQERDGFSHEQVFHDPVMLEGRPIYQVGDKVTLPSHDRDISGTIGYVGDKDVRIDTGPYSWSNEVVSRERFDETIRQDARNAGLFTLPTENYRITDDTLGAGGPKAKFRYNVEAIRTLKSIVAEGRSATPEEQETLAWYVGWGGIPDAFDQDKSAWTSEYAELKALLTDEEYASARASTLNAHYTSPTVIRAIYRAIGNMGFSTGNILEPACGIGNFFGLLPESMANSKLYGVELDSITGRIAKLLYPKANITVAGFETTDRRDFYDVAIGNVPFGQYQVRDRAYDKLGFSIHDYFFAKSIDQVRPGGVIAFLTSRYTMDKQSPEVRRYIAERAELLGAIRLPNNAFKQNAGTEVVSDILFLQKRDRPTSIMPGWVQLGTNGDGFDINSYFLSHPEMVLGTPTSESTQYGRQDYTVAPILDADLAEQLHTAVSHIHGQITETELPDLGDGEEIDTSLPADPNVKNYSYTVVDGEVYYRENSRMVRPELNQTAKERVMGLVELRDCVQDLIFYQMHDYTDNAIYRQQAKLDGLYDSFTDKHGLISSRGNSLAFSDDSSYFLLCSLEVLDEDGNLERKADMFTKRTIKQAHAVTNVDTAAEALAVSISEKARVDMPFMMQLSGKNEEELTAGLSGVIFLLPESADRDSTPRYVPADEYLSGNIREKLARALIAAEKSPTLAVNVEALEAALPKDLDASEIDVRLGATWVGKEYVQQFMYEQFQTPRYLHGEIEVNYTKFTAEWGITNKNRAPWNDVAAFTTYGTERASAYRILEETLNLRDIRIYDTKTEDGKERRVLNRKETEVAQQKQRLIKEAFQDWIWKDPQRRQTLVRRYNDQFNSCCSREYDGRHITLSGINPEISLREHQLNAVAHVLYGGNTLLAHEVGAGKTFEMVAAAMESKRLGLCQKSLFAVPNHLTEQWASEFLRLYPSANILVTTRKDFESRNRKKFCAKIATGDYDAIIIGHSQFERIPVSQERQARLLQDEIWEIEEGLEELKSSGAERFTIKQLERTKKSLEARLEKLNDNRRKDDVVTFEQLGIDRLYVDEAHSFKNLFLYTKMRNVAGLSTTDAQKSSDMLLKCRYIDEKTEGKGVVFATGTPISNSMTELYAMQRYLQNDALHQNHLNHFDCWASTFGETSTEIELAPEGTGYRARTRFAKFFNLPELMTMFKEVADIKTADQLNLPRPTTIYHNEVAQPTGYQQDMVQELSKRAAEVHTGRIDPKIDNMLKITSDGRKLGLDQRLISPILPDDPNSKVNMCVNNIARIWEDGMSDKLTQLVFCDISTPKARAAAQREKTARTAGDKIACGGDLHALLDAIPDAEADPPFSVYEDIRDKLIARGIPAEQIAFIHDANTEVRKKDLFAKVRSGQVRVLMGSTFKMGAGVNVQDRLIALHDLDCPWRPGDLEQRSGRIIRQGNRNAEVHIYRYVTEGTFDSYLWQTVEKKQKFISQIMTSKSPVRSCEDVDETALTYAEIKALCAGNPLIKEKMDLDIEVARLRLLKADHQSQQYKLEDNLLKNFPEQIEQNKGYIAGFEADMITLAQHPHPAEGFAGMVVRGDNLTHKDNAGAAILETYKEIKDSDGLEIGNYRGFAMSLTVENFGRDIILTLKGQMSHRAALGRDARGNLIRIDNALTGIPERLEAVKVRLENIYAQVEAAKAELGKPFQMEDELRQKSARLAELDIALNIDANKGSQQPERRLAKNEQPSVLEGLNRPLPPHAAARKARSRQEVL